MQIKVKEKELFRKILTINYPLKPKIKDFSYKNGEGLIQFEEQKKLSKIERELIEAGYSHFGLYFSSEDLLFPDLIDIPEEKKVANYKNLNFFFWQEKFPEKWKEYLKKPLFLFFPEKKTRGFTAISRYFQIESIILGKKVFYFNIKENNENSYENFLKLKGNEKWDIFILDHLSFADQESFEKFLFFILKAPYENYEIVATQWPGKTLPEGDFLEIPKFSFPEVLKIFYFPCLEKEKYLSLIEENLEKFEYFPGNLVMEFLKIYGFEEKVPPVKKEKKYCFNEKKVEEFLKEGKLFQAYPYLPEIKKRKELYELLLGWQGDWETLLLILKKPKKELLPVLFFLGWDGFLEIEKLSNFLEEDLYLLLKDRKKNYLERLKKTIIKNEVLSFYLKLIYADRIFSSGKKEAEDIFKELEIKKDLKPFEGAQLNRFLSYYYFYKGNIEKALKFNNKWIEISSENGWLWQMPLAFNDLSVFFMEKKDYENAKRSAQTALNFSFFLSEEKKENVIYFNLGVILTYLEEFEKSKEIFKKLEKTHRENGDNYSLIFDLFEISRIFYLEGELEEGFRNLKEAEKLLESFPEHPRFFQILILKTRILLWFSGEEYLNSLNYLKNLKNYPPHLEPEIKEILSQGALRKGIDYQIFYNEILKIEKNIKEGKEISFIPSNLEEAIRVLEWKIFYPEKVPEDFLRISFNFFEKKGLNKWKTKILKEKTQISLPVFEIFKERELNFEKIPFDFKLILKDGSIIEKGELKDFEKILIPGDILLYIPKDFASRYSEDIWIGWVYGLIYKKNEEEGIEIKFPEELENFNGFYYSSLKMKKIVENAKKLAKSEIPIHIYGETGTGKEILAKAIHQESRRFHYPFLPVNCSAIPENLFESEFFGWKKGSFTGALMDRPGYFEQADRGTLFLDEIGELPLNLQAKLLRVLQEKEIQRLGDVQRKKVDFRLITATNKDLKKMVEEGKFREDLYFRIVVGSIGLPPLRERKEEIKPLANLIISKNLKNFDIKNYKIDPLFFKGLEKREWKGNIRELENYIVSLMANLEEGGTLKIQEGFIQKLEEKGQKTGNYHQLLNNFKRELVEEAMKRANNSRKDAAKILGITPQALGYILRELKMVK